jgi:hypothetical protein
MRAPRRKHLGAVALVIRVLGESEKGADTLAVENWNRDARTIPAEKTAVDYFIRDATGVKIFMDTIRQCAMIFGSEVEEVGG